MENFGGDLELKRRDLTWSGQVDLTEATPRSALNDKADLIDGKLFQSIVMWATV